MAGVQLVWRMVLERARQGARRDCDFPNFVYVNVPFQDTDHKGTMPDCEELFTPVHDLNKLGCDVGLVLCNTSEMYFDALAKQFRGQLLSIVDIVSMSCKGTVAVLASRATRDLDLYGPKLKRFGCDVITLNEDQQEIVDDAISNCMGFRLMEKVQTRIADLEWDLVHSGANQIVIGCTELSMIRGHVGNVIDAGFVAIEEAVRLCQ